MDNPTILKLLEGQRDSLFNKLKGTSISSLYKEQYADIKAGRIFVFDNAEKQMLRKLKKLSQDTSRDGSLNNKLNQYLSLDNTAFISYFQNEFQRVFNEIISSGRQDEMQAIFIVYDAYYDYISNIFCYGIQDYPMIEEPRYLKGEFDYDKHVLFLDIGINFQPAWVNCEEFGDLDYLNIDIDLENLFILHSRVLLHQALDNLNSNNQLGIFKNRPFSFYINEHDCEVMMLYKLN